MSIHSAAVPSRIARARRFWRHPMLAPFNNLHAWDRLTSVVNPLWSLTETRARVVRVVDEAPAVRSVWLKPNVRFGRFRPGQHVLLELELDGVRHARCFSLSHAPRADGLLRLTIKRKEDGPVSTAAHSLAPGQIVRLGRAQGDFAPRDNARKLLLISAGSGVTPMLSVLHGLSATGSTRDVVVLHSDRSAADMIFAQELQRLASVQPWLQLHLHTTQSQGRMNAQQIALQVPDWAERETMLCGPDGFMRMVETMYADAGRDALLQSESYGRRSAPINPDAAEHSVTCENTEQVFTVQAGQNLLVAAEAAGLQPRFGCRRGICRTCQCLKRSGTVTNLLTGQVSSPGEELIQLCISTPQSAIDLAL